jgi:hypothetical protein
MTAEHNRPLTDAELQLARWMIEHGAEDAKRYSGELEMAEVTPWRCPCGCASIKFPIKGCSEPAPGVHILGNFLVGEGDDQAGVFIYSSGGRLRGIEVYGLAGSAPRRLPLPQQLSTFESAGKSASASTGAKRDHTC